MLAAAPHQLTSNAKPTPSGTRAHAENNLSNDDLQIGDIVGDGGQHRGTGCGTAAGRSSASFRRSGCWM